MILQAVEALLREFHKAFAHPAPEKPTLDGYPFELRMRLIMEEALEFVEACGYAVRSTHEPDQPMSNVIQGTTVKCVHCGAVASAAYTDERPCTGQFVKIQEPDWPEMIDALCDLLYVTVGSAVGMGVPLTDFFREVHRANMAKAGGGKDAGGKTAKPPGWKPPRIKELLDELLQREAAQ